MGVNMGGLNLAGAGAARSPDFEQVGEVGCEVETNADALATVIEVSERDPLEAGGVPQELGAPNMDEAVAEDETTVVVEIRVRQIAGECRIVVSERRAQKK